MRYTYISLHNQSNISTPVLYTSIFCHLTLSHIDAKHDKSITWGEYCKFIGSKLVSRALILQATIRFRMCFYFTIAKTLLRGCCS